MYIYREKVLYYTYTTGKWICILLLGRGGITVHINLLIKSIDTFLRERGLQTLVTESYLYDSGCVPPVQMGKDPPLFSIDDERNGGQVESKTRLGNRGILISA